MNCSKLISIEGNIGAGKSSIINELRKSADIKIIDEPVKEWGQLKNDDNSQDLLQTFYTDKTRYGYLFQNMVIFTRYKAINYHLNQNKKKSSIDMDNVLQDITQNLNTPQKEKIDITERCLQADKAVFASMLHDSKHINAIEWQMYLYWYNYFIDQSRKLDKVIYLDVAPEVCYERIHTHRKRKGEEGISLEYLTEVDKYYKAFINEIKEDVVIIKNNGDMETVLNDIKSHIYN